MKRRQNQKRFAQTALLLGVGVGMLSVSGFLISQHVAAILEVREVSLPLVADIPSFERRLATLTNQIEMAELHRATRIGSQEEHVNVFVLPEGIDFDRLLSVFDIFGAELQNQGLLTEISDIAISDPIPAVDEGLEVRSLSMNFSAHEEGVQNFLSLIHLAGLLTIGDTLSEDESRLLLQKTEEENPAGIVAIEQFLSTNLLSYTREPKTYEAQLLRSFSSPLFKETLDDTLQSSLLRDARRLLGGEIGVRLKQYSLWPLPLMMVDDIRIHAGRAPSWYTLGVSVHVYSRTSDK